MASAPVAGVGMLTMAAAAVSAAVYFGRTYVRRHAASSAGDSRDGISPAHLDAIQQELEQMRKSHELARKQLLEMQSELDRTARSAAEARKQLEQVKEENDHVHDVLAAKEEELAKVSDQLQDTRSRIETETSKTVGATTPGGQHDARFYPMFYPPSVAPSDAGDRKSICSEFSTPDKALRGHLTPVVDKHWGDAMLRSSLFTAGGASPTSAEKKPVMERAQTWDGRKFGTRRPLTYS